jgi:transcriptional regulator with XRE-family HTH domain
MEQRQVKIERLRLGNRLRACRVATGLSRQEVAAKLQLSERRLGSFERGAAAISAIELRDLATALKTPITALFEINSAENPAPGLTAIELMGATDEGADLAEAFAHLKTRRLRRHLAQLAQELAQQEDHVPH